MLAFPDIFGVDSGRTKQDAESLGKLGYAVVLVDLVDGEYLKETVEDMARMPAWLQQNSFDAASGARIRDAIEYLRTEAGVMSISSYGYC